MNKELLYTKPSTPILNYIRTNQNAMEAYSYNVMILHQHLRSINNNSILQAVKSLLGKQSYCANLSDRNWIWERDSYRIFVSKAGVSIELFNDENDLTKTEFMDTMSNIFNEFGLPYFFNNKIAETECAKRLGI